MFTSLPPTAELVQFLVAYMIVMMTPGPVALTTASIAALHGFSSAMPLVMGIAMGRVTLVGLLALAASQLSSGVPLPIMQVAGSAVLLWMALRIARMPLPLDCPVHERPQFHTGLFTAGFVVSFTSPIAASFFAAAFMGVLLPLSGLSDVLAVAVAVGAVDASWFFLVALVISRPVARAAVLRCHLLIRRTAAVLLAFLAFSSAAGVFVAG